MPHFNNRTTLYLHVYHRSSLNYVFKSKTFSSPLFFCYSIKTFKASTSALILISNSFHSDRHAQVKLTQTVTFRKFRMLIFHYILMTFFFESQIQSYATQIMISFGLYYDYKLTNYKYLVSFNKKNNDISPEEEIKVNSGI